MRVLLYGMQTSGASLLTYFLGQTPKSIALIDVWARHRAPPVALGRPGVVIAKCVITTQFDLDDHVGSFRPDRTILVLRHPAHNYESLGRKRYVAEGGPLDGKFARLESAFRERDRFDLVLTYEQFMRDPQATVAALQSIDVPAHLDYYQFKRSAEQIRRFNCRHDAWCREHFGSGWHIGNVQGSGLNPRKLFRTPSPEVEARVRELCPTLSAYYDVEYAWLREHAAAAEPQAQPRAEARPRVGRGLRSYLERLRARIG